MYVRYGMSDAEIRSLKLTRLVPVRRKTRGQAPGITSAESMHADHEKDEDKWVFPNVEPTKREERVLMGAVLEIAVRTAWENSVYQFGGRYYHQQQGGPTGRRITMAASRIVMGSDFGKKLTNILDKANIKTWLKSAYVDDIRLIISLFRNLGWNNNTKTFTKK